MSITSPAPAGSQDALDEHAKWLKALRLLREALELLDESDAPPDVGARLDSAIHWLEAAVHKSVQRPR